jgi:hypothetical protein
MAVSVTAGVQPPIDGDGKILDPMVEVAVPTNLDFHINPFRISAPDDMVFARLVNGRTQVSAPDFIIINLTETTPVKVSLALEVKLATGITLVDTVDTTATSGEVSFGLLGATLIPIPNGTSVDQALVMAATPGDFDGIRYDVATLGAIPVAIADRKATIEFALNNLENGTDGDLAQDNIASFTFMGALNTGYVWQENDISVSGIFTFTPMDSDDYEELDYSDGSLVGVNQLPGVPNVTPTGFGTFPTIAGVNFVLSNNDQTLTVNLTAGQLATNANIAIPFFHEGNTVAPKQLAGTPLAPADLPAARGTWAAGANANTAGTLTILADRTNNIRAAAVGSIWTAQLVVEGVTYTVILRRAA